ncbi:M20/M25/M40 family metallo-hydrolase [Nocardiopsis potens]|uniref:M20/M25/M40 family metallo-hydrolase n=1 Tax=Nocardiopsis potens TaxID=1246458 RepID=UPI00034BFACA|nr:M20/M25/M40 family metallo-hydrolase [Nocardiopsis potens]
MAFSDAVTAAPAELAIDGDRLWASLMELARIGTYDDAETGLTGVDRRSLTDEDAEGRRLLVRWMSEAGLEVAIDEMGTASAFDGCLGVLGALEVVRSLNDQGITTRRPLVIAAFTEEEGGSGSARTCSARRSPQAGSPSTTPTA